MIYSQADVRQAFDEATYLRAEAYHRKAHVMAYSWTGEGTLTATVQGSGRNVYNQAIEVCETPPRRLRITGSCTCPVGSHCPDAGATEVDEPPELDPRGFVVPQIGDVVKVPSKWPGEYDVAQVDFVQFIESRQAYDVDVRKMKPIGGGLYVLSGRMTW